MGVFHSAVRANFPAPGTAQLGDIWFDTGSGETFWGDSEGNLHNLLDAAPYPVEGKTGADGRVGPEGPKFEMEFPTETQIGGVVSTIAYGAGVNDGNGNTFTGRVVTGIENGIGRTYERK
jgi:hypothetical protein